MVIITKLVLFAPCMENVEMIMDSPQRDTCSGSVYLKL